MFFLEVVGAWEINFLQVKSTFTKLVHKLVNPYGQPDPKKTVFLWPPLAILVAGSNDAKSPSLELQLQLQRMATC